MSELIIKNPIIKGFNPDPSILRVGDDYYIANSTFEWHPGIQIHHSRDLVNWRLIGHVLTTKKQLDMIGLPNSSGIWAPSLSYHDGLFYMVYTVVRTRTGPYKDLKNYLVTSENILGPWSDPIYLNSAGFDPSLFHDENGSKWIVCMQWDYRKDKPAFGGILLQEYDSGSKKVVGQGKIILKKDILIEGPNLYKYNGMYYLMLAQGGTGWQHSIAMARSECIDGPYELDHQEVVLTSKYDPKLELQKAGHGELVESQDGQWYLVHLCSRPVGPDRRCILGRETAIQKCFWDQSGWLRLASDGFAPQLEVPVSKININESFDDDNEHNEHDDFGSINLDLNWASLRRPVEYSWLSLSMRPGWARIYGRESVHSLFEQSLIARRLQSFRAIAKAKMQFKPTHFNHSAGLICWYDTENHYYLRVTYDEDCGVVLGIVLTDNGNYSELLEQVQICAPGDIYLKAEIDYDKLQFGFSYDGISWINIRPVLDMTKLSDDYADGLRFTGAMVGLCVQDLQGGRQYADFDFFSLENIE